MTDDASLMLAARHYADQGRSVYVRLSRGRQFRVDAENGTETEQASDKQLRYIGRLCDEKAVVRPDTPLSKAQASEIIDSLQADTYDPDKWKVPF